MPNEIGLTRDKFIDDVIGRLGTLYPGAQGDAVLTLDDLEDISRIFVQVHEHAAREVERYERHEDPRRV